jgi:hypothetical protein
MSAFELVPLKEIRPGDRIRLRRAGMRPVREWTVSAIARSGGVRVRGSQETIGLHEIEAVIRPVSFAGFSSVRPE